jgi:cytochrome c-type biogenesis protein CcmH
MTLWLVIALMTAATIFAVLWPLARRKPLRPGSDVAVYRDQLDEIERDRSTGLIGSAEAEAARVEVSRRLIAAADAAAVQMPAQEPVSILHRRVTAIAGLLLLPVGAIALYLTLGSPDLPGEPLAGRTQTAADANNLQNLVAKVEDHLTRNPNDGRAWEVLAPVYMRVGRYDDAARAWSNVIALSGTNAEREADHGEAIVAAANGVVTAEAKAAFDRSLKIDPQNVMARFYKGMAADQDGRRAEAEKIWNDLIAGAPPNAPWIDVVRQALARNTPAGATTAAAAPGADAVPPGDHDVNAMVERLAERLKKDGSDVQGWLQLVRSYRVLDKTDKMQAAIADARRALANDPAKLRQFNDGSEAAASAAPAAAAPPPPPAAAASAVPAAGQHQGSMDAMLGRLADRLKKNGSDVQGWVELVRSYRTLNQNDKAEAASADARRALAGNPDGLRQFTQGLEAVASAPPPAAPFAATAPAAPPMAPVAGGLPGPSAADIAAAAKMAPDAQNEMIRTMVARLADRLKQNGSDVAGWERLLRAYMVLGDHAKAQAAAADARKALAGDPDKLRQIDAVIKDLKVEG